MQQALEIAKTALATGDVPVGALILNPEFCRLSLAVNLVQKNHSTQTP